LLVTFIIVSQNFSNSQAGKTMWYYRKPLLICLMWQQISKFQQLS